jgi:hypothetical protein
MAQRPACLADTGLACERDTGWRIRAGAVRLDPEAAEECLEGLSAAGCNALQAALPSDEFEVFDMSSGCEMGEMIRPDARLGNPCGRFDCAEGFCPFAESRCHRCQRFAAIGAPCQLGLVQCDPAAAFCGPDSSGASRCQPLKSAGSPCAHWSQCKDQVCRPAADGGSVCGRLGIGDRCARADACGPDRYCRHTGSGGVCSPRIKTGNPCMPQKPDDGCAEGDARCVDGRCLVHPYVVGSGGDCDGFDVCREGLYCKRFPNLTGTCTPQGHAGEDCQLMDFGSCQPGLKCVSGHCVAPGSVGDGCAPPFGCKNYLACSSKMTRCVGFASPRESCAGKVPCLGGWCDRSDGGETCVALRAGGESCLNADECESGWCDPGPDGGTNVCRGWCAQ